MNNTKEKIFVTLLCFLFLMGALRFFYSTSFKHEGILTTETYLEKKLIVYLILTHSRENVHGVLQVNYYMIALKSIFLTL